jgi:putative PIN family toxin of toxin-antitoxin system
LPCLWPIESEIRSVLARPRFANRLTAYDRDEILALIADLAVWIEPKLTVTDCRDKKDNIYLELAASVGADAIISSDGDLLELDPWRGVRILSPRAFLDRS